MSGFYVLDVPDFQALVRAVQDDGNCTIHELIAGYRYVEFSTEIEITRKKTGLGAAVWFGCLTGGLDGKIVEFTSEVLRLAPTNEPIFED